MGVSFTPRFDAGELGEWFHLWITAWMPAILELGKRVAERVRLKPSDLSSLRFLGETVKSVRVLLVAVLCALMTGTVAGTAAAEAAGVATSASSSIVPSDDSGWGGIPR
ncbi:hypothetical protein [Streptomyces sp. NPDC049916]|uniref:hypothetical protein n=1 Tax=Streptomyces sp. NPDC049916 TaxID=3155156 RepID=UPI00344192BA